MKLRWNDLLNLWIWHSYPSEGLVSDDTAYVAALRVQKWIDYMLGVLEAEPSNPTAE